MKIGGDSKNKQLVAIALGGIAVAMVAWSLISLGVFSSSPSPAPAVAPAVVAKPKVTPTLDPRLQIGLLAAAENVRYEGQGKNIFLLTPESKPTTMPKVKISPLLRKQQEAALQAQRNLPPPPPPINLKYFGLSSSKGEKMRALLSEGDDVFVAREGDVIERRYRIVHITPTSIEVEDLLHNFRRSLPLSLGS